MRVLGVDTKKSALLEREGRQLRIILLVKSTHLSTSIAMSPSCGGHRHSHGHSGGEVNLHANHYRHIRRNVTTLRLACNIESILRRLLDSKFAVYAALSALSVNC